MSPGPRQGIMLIQGCIKRSNNNIYKEVVHWLAGSTPPLSALTINEKLRSRMRSSSTSNYLGPTGIEPSLTMPSSSPKTIIANR